MIVTRIGPVGDVQPAQASAPVRPVGPGSLEGSPVPPAGPRPIDAAAALRILYEEVRAALAVRAGALLDEGYDRSLAQLQRLPATPAAATTAIEQARAELVRTLETSATAAKAPPPQLARAFERVLVGFTSAVEDRVGKLPPELAPACGGGEPAESVLALARALRFVARDPAFAMRATPSVLEAAVADGAQRAARSLAQLPTELPGAHDLIEDLRAILGHALRTPEPPAVPASRPGAAASTVAAAAGSTSPPGGSVLARPVQAFVAELTRALAEATGRAPPATTPITAVPDPPAGAAVALLDATRLLAPLAAGDPRATREFLAGEFDAAATLFPGDARAFLRLVGEGALALLRDQEPPFRLDLAPWRGPRATRRRTHGEAGVDGIESTDLGDELPLEGDGTAGAALAELSKGQ